MSDLTQVTYCGLYCGLCAQRNRIPRQARDLRSTMKKEGWGEWSQQVQGFKEFWTFLGDLADSESRCSCRAGACGPPLCGIRKCARRRGVEICPFCSDYPCKRIMGLAKSYVTLVAEASRTKEIGIDAWIAEQEEKRKTGFAYVDVRCEPYAIPDD